jgi:hypothetical protein
MKEIFAITEKQEEGQTKPKHVLFGVDKDALKVAITQTDARQKITWERDYTWGLMCTDKTYKWLLERLIWGGFDPYEIPDATDIYLREMARKKIRFYKEVIML